VLFRDESQQVIRKATTTSQVLKRKRESVSVRSLAGDLVDTHTSSPGTLQLLDNCPLLLSPDWDPGKDEAVCFFLNRFAWQASSLFFSAWKGGSSTGSKALVTGIASVGLVMLSSIRNSPSLRLSAMDEYASTLQLTNAALSNQTEVTSDTTLAAIILLSLYEVRAGSLTLLPAQD
jgi:hypothetical protein